MPSDRVAGGEGAALRASLARPPTRPVYFDVAWGACMAGPGVCLPPCPSCPLSSFVGRPVHAGLLREYTHTLSGWVRRGPSPDLTNKQPESRPSSGTCLSSSSTAGLGLTGWALAAVKTNKETNSNFRFKFRIRIKPTKSKSNFHFKRRPTIGGRPDFAAPRRAWRARHGPLRKGPGCARHATPPGGWRVPVSE